MRSKRHFGFGYIALILVLASEVVWAQARLDKAVLAGTVIDAATREPLAGANVVVKRVDAPEMPSRGTATAADGSFELANLEPGVYRLSISYIGYVRYERSELHLQAGGSQTLTVALEPTGLSANPILVTASRRPEKLLDAPAAVSVVEADEIEARTTLTLAEHLKALPGVDMMQSGLATTDIAVRGFNEVFAGSLLLLTDNRIARVPSLRLNVYSLIPATNDDIERIEVVSGPGSALYGPNSANGVLHILTKSPFQSQGTTVSVGGGERSVLLTTFRHARKFGDNVALKISGQYFQGENWKFLDPAEPDSIIKGRQTTMGRINETGVIANRRDFNIDRYNLDLRLDIRLGEQTTLILNSALNKIDEIVVTPIGSARSNGWRYSYFQSRFKHKNLFAQIFTNRSNSGDTYFLRTGDVIFDRSKLTVGQIQHFLPLGERQSFTYGLDALFTRPDTRNTINGNYEDNDNIDEIGVYLQSETTVASRLKLIAAARLDQHNRIENAVFSPRAALVYKSEGGNSLRLTFNKAFSTPTANNLFLDILTAPDAFTLGAMLENTYPFDAGIDFRAQGVPETGFHFNVSENGPQFRSPFAPLDPRGLQPVDYIDFNDPIFTNTMWSVARQILIDGFRDNLIASGIPPSIANSLAGDLDRSIVPAQVTGVKNSLARINLETQSFEPVDGVTDIPRLKPTITETYEFGYKGLLGSRAAIAFDVYHSKIHDFIGPLLIETPNVFLDAQSLRAAIEPVIASNFDASGNFFLKGVLLQLDAPANGGNNNGSPVDELVALFADSAAVIPLGTVSPREALDPTAVLLTFRNFGDIALTGLDFSLSYYFSPRWSFTGNYSFVSRNLFERSATLEHEIPLNAPKHKASLAVHYTNLRAGLRAELRGRFVDSFPFRSGELVGTVDDYTVFDFNVEGHLSERTRLGLAVSNLLNNKHRELIGAPEIGRLAIVRLTREF